MSYFTPLQGLRMRNAIKNSSVIKMALVCCGTSKFDLVVRDCPIDSGEETNNCLTWWESPDIWIRNQNDNLLIHQNPIFGQGQNYVNVRITNVGCIQSDRNVELKLYWTKAGTNLPMSVWNGGFFHNNKPLGGFIGSVNLSSINPYEDTIVSIPWDDVPNPDDYSTIENPWHFCILAKIESSNDISTLPDNNGTDYLIKNSNNLALKNVTVIKNNAPFESSGKIHIANFDLHNDIKIKFDLSPYTQNSSNIFNEAEIKVVLDDNLYNLWQASGFTGNNIINLENKTIKVNRNSEIIINNLPVGFVGVANIKVNFLTDLSSNDNEFEFNLLHFDANTDELIGGELFKVYKNETSDFNATISEQSGYLKATLVNEPATYNWYDSDGNFLYSGENYTYTNNNTDYILEVTSNSTGFKDYDMIEVSNNTSYLTNIYPNPATNTVNIEYGTLNCTNAYIMLVNLNNSSTANYILNLTNTNIDINLSGYNSGLYRVVLFCDNQVIESKNLIIN